MKLNTQMIFGTTKGAKVALYDDFRDSHMKVSEFINFIDYNPHHLNIKGDNQKNTYEYILITSVQNPEYLYENLQNRDSEPKKQWMRRLEIIHLETKFNKNQYIEFLIKQLKDVYNIEFDGKHTVKYPDDDLDINEKVKEYNKIDSTEPKKEDQKEEDKVDKEMEEIMKNVDINDFIDDDIKTGDNKKEEYINNIEEEEEYPDINK